MITSNSDSWQYAVKLFVEGLEQIEFSKDYSDVHKAEKYAYERLGRHQEKSRTIVNKMFGNYKLAILKGLL